MSKCYVSNNIIWQPPTLQNHTWKAPCCGGGVVVQQGMAESSLRWELRAAGSERERGGNSGSQEHPTRNWCLLLPPQSGRLNTLAGGEEGGEPKKQHGVGTRPKTTYKHVEGCVCICDFSLTVLFWKVSDPISGWKKRKDRPPFKIFECFNMVDYSRN